MKQQYLKKIGDNSRVASATDTVVASAFVVFVVCVASFTVATPDSADIADEIEK